MANLMDPRSALGEYSRGRNIYNGGSYAAFSGPGSAEGRPPNIPQEALLRRLRANFSPDQTTTSGLFNQPVAATKPLPQVNPSWQQRS